MITWMEQFGPVQQALIGTLFTWGVTALGAALVFFFKTIKKNVLNGMLGFAAGVMIAASFWSLLSRSSFNLLRSFMSKITLIWLRLKRT